MPYKDRNEQLSYLANYREGRRERLRKLAAIRRWKKKIEVVCFLGGKCVVCGIDDPIT